MSKHGVTLFAAVSGPYVCCVSHNGDISFFSRPSQKFVFDNSGVLQIQLTIFCSLSRSLK